jgi:tyrosyl-tRNA synthetase
MEKDKFSLITRNLEEILTPEDLKSLLANRERLVHYIGFEISGFVHLGTGLMSALKIKDFQQAGVKCQIFLADWHTWINEKLDGDLETIKKVAVGYFKEALVQSLKAVGADSDKVEFILGTDLYSGADEYWLTFIEVAKNTTLARTLRSIDILGRKQSEGIDFAKLLYPIMQIADLFYLGANLPHAGLDQRKAYVVARAVALELKTRPLFSKNREKLKPIALHHHLLLGLGKPPVSVSDNFSKDEWRQLKIEMKMSKSKPETCVFVHDSPEEIEQKIMKAFCPPKDTAYNPIIDWAINLILPLQRELKVKTSAGEKLYDYNRKAELSKDYEDELIHPLDLKEAVIRELQTILKPIYSHFSSDKAKKLKEELEKIKPKN